MHPSIKKSLGYKPNIKEKELLSDWKKRTAELCKPCWELHYCPYGPVVEGFPLLPVLREEAKEHNDYLKICLKTGKLGNGATLDKAKRNWFIKEVKEFKASDYPEEISRVLVVAACRVFGHVCPVYFVAEPLTETKNRRKHNRSIPRDVMLKVVRRDGQICQECYEPVPDNQVEFDHIIPFSKGGRSTVENLRLIHKKCNRRKSSSLKKILSENPIEHLWELRKQSKKEGKNSQ
ncbi:MAG: HNH endonuclease [Candidatus Omnitrophota bacterium]